MAIPTNPNNPNHRYISLIGIHTSKVHVKVEEEARLLGVESDILQNELAMACLAYVQTRTIAGQRAVIVAYVWKQFDPNRDHYVQAGRNVSVYMFVHTPRNSGNSGFGQYLFSQDYDTHKEAQDVFKRLVTELCEEVNFYRPAMR